MDALWNFLQTRDPNKVLREAWPVEKERLLAEAEQPEKDLLRELSPGMLRRKLLVAEQDTKSAKVRVYGNKELLALAAKQKKRADEYERRYRELQAELDRRARNSRRSA